MWDSAMQPNEFLTLFAKKKSLRQKSKQFVMCGERERKRKERKKKAERS